MSSERLSLKEDQKLQRLTTMNGDYIDHMMVTASI